MDSDTPQPAPGCPNCERLQRRIEELEAKVAKFEALVEELRRGGKRQAAPFSKGDPKPEPKKPGRKPGAEYGTSTYRQPPPIVDEVHEAPLPRSCPDCGGDIEPVEVVPQFQEDVPRRPIRRQINVAVGRCKCCLRRVQGRHPLQTSDALGAAASQLGAEAQALAVSLNKDTGASHGKISRLFSTVFGLSVSRGGVAQAVLRAAERCRPAHHEILVVVRNSTRVYPDETGWKVGGRLHWLWALVTDLATAYVIRDSRGHDVPEEFLGLDYDGVMGHDGWAPYDFFKQALYQQFVAHLLRRCIELLEHAVGGAVSFPRKVKGLLQDALDLRDRRDAGTVTPHGIAVATGRLQNRLDALLANRRMDVANERLAKHLRNHHDELFTFLREPNVEATNWPAEQAIRPSTANRKVWGGNRTERGAEAQGILLSILRTLWQRGANAIDFLSTTLRAPPGETPHLFKFRAIGARDPDGFEPELPDERLRHATITNPEMLAFV